MGSRHDRALSRWRLRFDSILTRVTPGAKLAFSLVKSRLRCTDAPQELTAGLMVGKAKANTVVR